MLPSARNRWRRAASSVSGVVANANDAPDVVDLRSWAMEHLLYEFGMLRETAEELARGHHAGDAVVQNALLESFTVHARGLLDFLYGKRRKRDDALASDFFVDTTWEQGRPARSGRLGEVNRRVGKEIAHLTYSRATVTERAKGWDISAMYMEMAQVFGLFVRLVPEETIGREFLEVANSLLPGRSARELGGISWLGSTAPASVATHVLRPAELADEIVPG